MLSTEATLMQGKGRLTLTGKLGDVMQESAQAGMSYVRSRSHLFGLPKDFYRHLDIHVHVPEGAIPKDGPSAGITLCTSIVSALTRIPVRCDVAMTGEITLRGKVLPIGGVKEKLLAAHRLGLRTVILPKDNEKDLADIPPEIQAQMSIHFVESMDEVLQLRWNSLCRFPGTRRCRSRAQVRRGCRAGQRIDQLNPSVTPTSRSALGVMVGRFGPRPKSENLSVT